MPRRKKYESTPEPATAAAMPVKPNGRPALAGLDCWRDSLDRLYKGNSPFECHCPRCTPHLWCAAAMAGNEPCWRPRKLTGGARQYPFCQAHYMAMVDVYPRPDAALTDALLKWTAAIEAGTELPSAPIPLLAPARIRLLWEQRHGEPDYGEHSAHTVAKARHVVRRALGGGA